ncbi:MAG TPA: 1,4-dihydroxy-2-naphthoate polyprenyltransferase [Acidimicrobiia bacterium]|nr:1,4-dihydroxy-2-naphthoate polyprenyltransferase [Acidimicrobiia bacterium]
MNRASIWIAGARPRTLVISITPVLVGTAAASIDGPTIWWRALAALVVAVALQVGVNYANDYSDGVRGTDRERRGPLRLTASGLASPTAVKRAAAIAFTLAAVVGLVVSIVVSPWLLLVGAAAIAAAVLYTGGPRPYGYEGLGEVSVLVFFGFVATAGSAFVQLHDIPAVAWWGSLAMGLPACAILLANNVRDVTTDVEAGKRTLAVRIGAVNARRLFVACIAGAFVAVLAVGVSHPLALLGLLAIPFALGPCRLVLTRADPPGLVAALVATTRLQLVLGVLLTVGLALS